MRAIIDGKEHGTQDQIAKRMGVSPAYISTLWKTGVGGRSIAAFAKLLGYRTADGAGDPEALRIAAYDWYRAQAPKTSARAQDPGVVAALEEVRVLYPLTDEQVHAILHRFGDEAFSGRDKDYWSRTIMEEVRQDHRREQASAAAVWDSKNLSPEDRELRKRQNVFREHHNIRRALDQAQADAEIEAVPETSKAIAPPSKSRKKA